MKTLKTGKKFLSVFLAMLIVITSSFVAVPSFAAVDVVEHDEHFFEFSAKHEPTCTKDGYELWVCTVSGCTASQERNIKPAYGHTYKPYEKEPGCTEPGIVGKKCDVCGTLDKDSVTYTDPVGHMMSSMRYEAQEDGTYYYYMSNCGRDGCGYTEYETYEDGEKVKYYTVEFRNEWVAKDHFVAEDGTVLAYSDDETERYTTDSKVYYVKENGSAGVYDGDTPQRDKTEAYGEYEFLGWKTEKSDEKYRFNTDLDTFTVTENTVFTAEFKGIEKYYDVDFYDGYKNISKEDEPEDFGVVALQHVKHGETIKYNPAENLTPKNTQDKSMHYYYVFNGWDLKYVPGEEKPLVESGNGYYGDAVKTVKIYSDHTVRPLWDAIPKQYKVIYHDFYGDIIRTEDGEDGVIFGYAETPSFIPSVEDMMIPQNDPAYYYEFGMGPFRAYQWRDTYEEGGNLKDVYALTVPDGVLEYNEEFDRLNPGWNDIDKGIIHLYPNIVKKAQYYNIYIEVMDIDGQSPAYDAVVQVTYPVPEGQATTLVTAPVIADENGRAVVRVPYGKSAEGSMAIGVYKVTATLDGRKAEGVITDTHINAAIAEDVEKSTLRLRLVEPKGDEKDQGCTCICHTFIGKIYITFLNIVYRLTGKKIVCCYDMYLKHGDKISYR